jgi:hypothetical protein
VEDRIVELQRHKANLANIALRPDGDHTGFDIDDLAFLFGGSAERRAA